MKDFIVGTCHAGRESYTALKDVGLNSLRLDIPFPFGGKDRTPSDLFAGMVEYVHEVRGEGMQPVGITPYPKAIPDWEGPPGSDGYFALAREAARHMADQFQGYIRVWESTNEMNGGHFRAPLDVDQAVRFVVESSRGIKDAGSDLWVGTNMAGLTDLAKRMFGDIYAADVAWDYIGIDGYFGTWGPGGPHTWNETFDWLNELAPLPAIVMEWGYSSKGGVIPPEEVVPDGTSLHERSMWRFGWEKDGEALPHTPEVQARFISEAMRIIRERAVGAFYYCWRDAKKCACGKEECPIEADWGLLDTSGNPKPSYYAMQQSIDDMGLRP